MFCATQFVVFKNPGLVRSRLSQETSASTVTGLAFLHVCVVEQVNCSLHLTGRVLHT